MSPDRDLVKAFIISQGNRLARGRRTPDLTPFEAALGTGLRDGAGAGLRFEDRRGQPRLAFEPWLARLHARGLRGFELVPFGSLATPVWLAVDLGRDGVRVYEDCRVRNALALPSARALVRFVREHPGQGIEPRAAHYARELGLVEEQDWDVVRRACAPREDELWVQAFELAISHVDVDPHTIAAWEELLEQCAARRGSTPALVFVRVGPEQEDQVRRPGPAPGVAEAAAALEAALEENRALARREGATHWTGWFTEALQRLRDPPHRQDPWVRVTAGCDIPVQVLSLARGAQKSHVFGGMGSWNDMAFDNDAQKERLYEAMCAAWAAVFAALAAHASAA